MFFIGVFGIESKQDQIRDIQNRICKSCKSMTSYNLIKTYDNFQFFFVPLFKWNVHYYLKARCCSSVFEIPRELGERLQIKNRI